MVNCNTDRTTKLRNMTVAELLDITLKLKGVTEDSKWDS